MSEGLDILVTETFVVGNECTHSMDQYAYKPSTTQAQTCGKGMGAGRAHVWRAEGQYDQGVEIDD